MKNVLWMLLVTAGLGQAQAQGPYYDPPQPGQLVPAPMVPVLPQRAPQVVNQTVVQPQVPVPVPSGPPQPVVPPNYEGWRDGWRESWVHEFRPLKDWDRYPANNYVPSTGYRPDGFYYNPSTGCYQRDVPPAQVCPQQTYQPVYVQPQPQYNYCYPRYYSYPQYRTQWYDQTCWPWNW